MDALPLTLLYLILLQTSLLTTAQLQDEVWKKATATYINETNASIITEGACGYGGVHKTMYGKYSAGLSTLLFNRGTNCGACYEGSPSVILTATDFCPPNYGLSTEYGGWCNFPKEHFEMSETAFTEIAEKNADLVPIQYRRVKCSRTGGIRFTVSGNAHFYQVLITNVGLDGDVVGVKVKGSRTGWLPMARNWGQNWECNINLIGQPLSFEVTTSKGRTLSSYNVAPANWKFGKTFEGKQF
ncbi:hypothetical protein ACFE04_011843 [Oxalis oulophora]